MSLLVIGSMAFDSVETPFGKADEVLGGSGTFFSVAASYFTDVRLVAVVGRDFPEEHLQMLRLRNIDLSGVKIADGATFRWKGRYGFELNEAQTLDTQLNVFADFKPELPVGFADSEFVFLANIDPELQGEVLRQVRRPRLIAADSMNFWITGKREALLETLKGVDLLVINEGETRQLAGEANLIKAAKAVLSMGPKTLIVKRGEYGVLMFSPGEIFAAPAYPLEEVFDPTGAGDTFAGGFMGYLAATKNLDAENIRRAIVYGSVMASFTVEDFSLNRLKSLTIEEIDVRFKEFKMMTEFVVG